MKAKKLIETIIPVSRICEEAEKEKTCKQGLPSNIHIWWTRTPCVISRTVLFASLVDDPSSHEELFPTLRSQQKERKRLLSLIEKLADVDCYSDKKIVEQAKLEIEKATSGFSPKVFDPFVGSGSVPVEAQRLGLSSISSDINPVSSMITTAISDIPSRFANTPYVHPSKKADSSTHQGIVEDIKYYGNEVVKKAYKKIGKSFPTVINPDNKGQIDVAAWIWVRTVECPNPTCNCKMPLSFCYDLAKRKDNNVWVEPTVIDGRVFFKIHSGDKTFNTSKSKIAHTALFKCPVCGEITTDEYVKEFGRKHGFKCQLLAIAAEENGKRVYIEATDEQEQIADIEKPKNLPHGSLPMFPGKFTPPSFGYQDYIDLFSNRQLLFISTMVELIIKIQKTIKKDAVNRGFKDDGIPFSNGGNGALAYSEAIRIVLMLTLSKYLDRYSTLCSWNSNGSGAIRNVFSRAAMPMIWDFAEGNPFSSAGGSFSNTLLRVCESLNCLPYGEEAITNTSDATVPSFVRDAIIFTDMPYYDRVPYQELSDYFYIWLRYGLKDIFPSVFSSDITLKTRDITSFAYRYSGNNDTANAIYVENMKLAINNLYSSASTIYPSVIGFMYKGFDALNTKVSEWELFVTALYEAGFSITASWPLFGKRTGSIPNSCKNDLLPIMVVVRKNEIKEPSITRRLFVSAVKREVPQIVEEMSKNVYPNELRPAIIGRALNIFTRYSSVIDADGSKMKPYIASRIIEQEIDTHIENCIKVTNNDEPVGGM